LGANSRGTSRHPGSSNESGGAAEKLGGAYGAPDFERGNSPSPISSAPASRAAAARWRAIKAESKSQPGCGWLNNTDRGGAVGGVAPPVGPEAGSLELPSAELPTANGFGIGGNGEETIPRAAIPVQGRHLVFPALAPRQPGRR
jgi:hypothetical protein